MNRLQKKRSTSGDSKNQCYKTAYQKAVGDVIKNTTDALPGLKNPQWTLGQKLAFDPAKEKFVGNSAADKLLTRDYRAPYIVPENV